MRISHKYHFIWISNPKTGSVSYRRLLDPYSDITSGNNFPFHHHTTLSKLKDVFIENEWDFDSYFKICAVRNPWNLLLSLYAYSKTDINDVKFWDKNQKYDPSSPMPFDEWISLDRHHEWFRKVYTLSVYTRGHNGEMLADLIFATDLDTQIFFEMMVNRCNLRLERNKLLQLNTTLKSSELMAQSRSCFSSTHINAMMEEIFWEEISLFNYKNPF